MFSRTLVTRIQQLTECTEMYVLFCTMPDDTVETLTQRVCHTLTHEPGYTSHENDEAHVRRIVEKLLEQ